MRTRISPNTHTFYAVYITLILWSANDFNIDLYIFNIPKRQKNVTCKFVFTVSHRDVYFHFLHNFYSFGYWKVLCDFFGFTICFYNKSFEQLMVLFFFSLKNMNWFISWNKFVFALLCFFVGFGRVNSSYN